METLISTGLDQGVPPPPLRRYMIDVDVLSVDSLSLDVLSPYPLKCVSTAVDNAYKLCYLITHLMRS